MFRVVINNMIENEKMKKYSINLKTKDYLNKDHAKIEKIVKKRDLKIEIWHYLIIYQTFQLHDQKRKRKDFRRFFLDVSIIKANEILSDICVVQLKTRDKLIIKLKKIAKESPRFVTLV
jgi:predicted SprT family Zn-dependent metalloprotease